MKANSNKYDSKSLPYITAKHQSADSRHHGVPADCGVIVAFAMSCMRSAGYVFEELVDVLGLCGPAGADAHCRVVVVHLLPNGKEVFGAEPVELLVAEDGELLVGWAVDEEWYALGLQCLLDAHGLGNGMARNVHVDTVGEEGAKLDTEQTALGQHASVALDAIAEVALQCLVRYHHSLAKQGANLGASDIEHIGQLCQLWQSDIALRRTESIAQACSVDKERKAVSAAYGADVPKFAERIYGAHFGWEGYVYHAWLHHVLRPVLMQVCLHCLLYLGGSELAIGRVYGQHLVACGLDSSRLVHVDMPRDGTYHTLIGSQCVCYDGGIGLCAPDQEVHVHIVPVASLAYQPPGLGTEVILAISHGLMHVGLHKALHYQRMRPLVIVALKLYHGMLSHHVSLQARL